MATAQIFCLLFVLRLGASLQPGELEEFRLFVGHEGVDTAQIHIAYGKWGSFRRLTKRETIRNVLPKRHDKLKVKLTFDSSEHALEFDLEPSKLVHDGAQIVVRHGEESTDFTWRDKGCYYQGHLRHGQRNGSATVYFCQEHLMGAGYVEGTEYNIFPHLDDTSGRDAPSARRRKRADFVGSGKAMVTWNTDNYVSGDHDDDFQARLALVQRHGRPEAWRKRVMRQLWGRGRQTRQADNSLWKDDVRYIEPKDRLELLNMANSGTPPAVDRGAHLPMYEDKLDLEAMVVCDENHTKEITEVRRMLGDSLSDAILIHYVVVKYTGVSTLYGNKEHNRFDMTTHLKRVELWRRNPPWYQTFSTESEKRCRYTTLGRATCICDRWPGEKPNRDVDQFDTVLLLTRGTGGLAGLAFGSGICKPRYKCHTSQSVTFGWWTEAHELGHTLNLGHDEQMPTLCALTLPDRHNAGFMGSNRNSFRVCYRVRTRQHFPSAQCLLTTNVKRKKMAFSSKKQLPVLVYGRDRFCRSGMRESAEALIFPPNLKCPEFACGTVDARSPDFGLQKIDVPGGVDGEYCGNGKVCLLNFGCVPWNYSSVSYNHSEYGPRNGIWYRWSRYPEECSATCGTGLQVAFRDCSDYMRPFQCKGNRFKAKLCNTDPCPGEDGKSAAEIALDRAGYMCTVNILRGYLDPGKFSGLGRPLRGDMTTPASLCTAACRWLVAGARRDFDLAGDSMMPDGTPCNIGPHSATDLLMKGVTYHCLRGMCTKFGCNKKSFGDYGPVSGEGVEADICGVCGGKGTTCKHGRSQFKNLKSGKGTNAAAPSLVQVIPAGSTKIRAFMKFRENGLDWISLFIYDKDDVRRIYQNPSDNSKNLFNWAGTYWEWNRDTQYIKTDGPIDQPVKLMILQDGKSDISLTKTVRWAYTPPPSSFEAQTCAEGQTAWQGGCKCPASFYGKDCKWKCKETCSNLGKLVVRSGTSCRCQCTSLSEGRACERCKTGRSGNDCQDCAVRCLNGGTLDTATCTCSCPSGCTGDDCSVGCLLRDCVYYNGSFTMPLFEKFFSTCKSKSSEESAAGSHAAPPPSLPLSYLSAGCFITVLCVAITLELPQTLDH